MGKKKKTTKTKIGDVIKIGDAAAEKKKKADGPHFKAEWSPAGGFASSPSSSPKSALKKPTPVKKETSGLSRAADALDAAAARRVAQQRNVAADSTEDDSLSSKSSSSKKKGVFGMFRKDSKK